MSKYFENVLEQAHELSRAEQLALISSIAQWLVEDEFDRLPESVLQENNRRLAAYDAGETQGMPYQEAMQQVRAQMNERG